MLPTAADAQRAGPLSYDAGKRIQIAADDSDLDNSLRSVRFIGNVVAIQGDAVLNADLVVVRYAASRQKPPAEGGASGFLEAIPGTGGEQVESLTASGNVTLIQGDRKISCDQASYMQKNGTITLTGTPRVWQGANFLSGHTIVLHLETQRVEVKGGPGGRVKAEIQPFPDQPDLSEKAKKRMEMLKTNPPPEPQAPGSEDSESDSDAESSDESGGEPKGDV